MTEPITMASTTEVIRQPQVEISKKNQVKDEKNTLIFGATGAGKTTFQVKSLLKSIDLLK